MKDKLININQATILGLNKAEIEKSALNLKSNLDKLTEYELLYKMKYLIEHRMECIKEQALEVFTEKFEGSASEKDNGFTVTLKNMYKYNYDEKVKSMEKQIKELQSELKKEKAKQSETAKGKVKSELIALTLH